MDAPHVTLDDATVRTLAGVPGGQVPLYNPAGEVVGYYISPPRMAHIEADRKAQYAEADRAFSPDEIARIKERRKNDPRPNIPHDEVIRRIEGM